MSFSLASDESVEVQFLTVMNRIQTTIDKNELRLEDQEKKDMIRLEWQLAALVLDR